MPEGPEIRRAADQIAKVIQGQTIEHIEVGLKHLEFLSIQLVNKKVMAVETRGKAMLIHFENEKSIYSHNQLYGVWKTSKRGNKPNTKRSLRLALHTSTKSALLYSASDIGIYDTPELVNHPFLSKIGPDILNPDLTWQEIRKRLLSKRFARRALSALYLDQHFIAGIGNYLRTEILFAAGIHPDYKPYQLDKTQVRKLAQQTLIISKRAYDKRGVTVSDSFGKHLAKTKDCYESIRFMAFNRETLPCRLCVTPITKAQRNSRRIYWCERCQPLAVVKN